MKKNCGGGDMSRRFQTLPASFYLSFLSSNRSTVRYCIRGRLAKVENTDKNQQTAACRSDLPPLCDELSPGVSSPRASCRLRPPSGKELLHSYYIVATEMQIPRGGESPGCLPVHHICLCFACCTATSTIMREL